MNPWTAGQSAADASRRTRALLCIAVAVVILVGKQHYGGAGADLVRSYLGNISVSFACYFLASIALTRVAKRRFLAAASALLAVEAFELSDGFGVMSNTYDPLDLVANAAGIAVAATLDLLKKDGTPAGTAG